MIGALQRILKGEIKLPLEQPIISKVVYAEKDGRNVKYLLYDDTDQFIANALDSNEVAEAGNSIQINKLSVITENDTKNINLEDYKILRQ